MADASWYQDHVYVAPCEVGRGVFAARPFASGDRILAFHGPLVDADHPLNQGDEQGNLLQVEARRYLVPDPPGVFVNHSCQPNAGIQRTTLIALRPIARDEEVRFDYSTTMDEDAWTMACQCGTPACRLLIRDFKYLPAALQAWYLERDLVQPFIVAALRLPPAA